MKRVVVAALTASAIALLVFACDDGGYFDDSYGYSNGGQVFCPQYDSCETCTPVVGCGWCFTSDGRGTCHSGPDRCEGTAFGWTWETTGCRVSADASVAPQDASRPVDAGVSPEGSPTDSAIGNPDDAKADDAPPVIEDATPPGDN